MSFSQLLKAGALVLCFGVCLPSAAYADPTPTPTPVLNIADYKVAMDKYKEDLKLFKSALQEYRNQVRLINDQFKGAMGKAANKPPMGAPKSQSQLLDDVKAKRTAGLNAAIARDEAIRALGAPPTPPTPPAKPIKPRETKVNR